MSNPFPKGTARFFPVPVYLVRSGILSRLTEKATKLYLFVLHEAQRVSATYLEISNEALAAQVGISTSTARRARTELCEADLLTILRQPGQPFVYVLLNPETQQELPSRNAQKYRAYPRAYNSKRLSGAAQCKAPNWNDIRSG